ncbi:MAG: 50S ribosomal protein L15 [Armatimonadetes bacterium]|nr:50S ribosomal protein L15 [Armatimonadota bacterium]
MNLGAIKRPPGTRKQRKRVGRGEGSGWGKTCGKGQKGQNYREQVNPRMEGGQNPLYRRLPHMRGKTNRAMNIGMFRKDFAIVNVAQLDRFEANTEVTPELLRDAGLVKQVRDGIKILGNGEVTKPLNVTVHAVSESARQKIEAAGGTVRVGS